MAKDKTYAEKLKDPRWLMRRRSILARDLCTCQSCGDKDGVMQVHHKYYITGREPWEYPDEALVLLCAGCHEVEETGRKQAFKDMNTAIAEVGFTREDIEKLTLAFKNIEVKPIYSYLLMSRIYRAICEAGEKFAAPIFEELEEGEF
jgi:hypothetical protein